MNFPTTTCENTDAGKFLIKFSIEGEVVESFHLEPKDTLDGHWKEVNSQILKRQDILLSHMFGDDEDQVWSKGDLGLFASAMWMNVSSALLPFYKSTFKHNERAKYQM